MKKDSMFKVGQEKCKYKTMNFQAQKVGIEIPKQPYPKGGVSNKKSSII
jgi:hypothetical protein